MKKLSNETEEIEDEDLIPEPEEILPDTINQVEGGFEYHGVTGEQVTILIGEVYSQLKISRWGICPSSRYQLQNVVNSNEREHHLFEVITFISPRALAILNHHRLNDYPALSKEELDTLCNCNTHEKISRRRNNQIRTALHDQLKSKLKNDGKNYFNRY